MARRVAKVSEEEIVAINEAAFFLSIWFGKYWNNYPPQGRWRAVDIFLDASRLAIYPALFTSPSGDSCIIY